MSKYINSILKHKAHLNRKDVFNDIVSELSDFYTLPFASLSTHLLNQGHSLNEITRWVNLYMPKNQRLTRQAIALQIKKHSRRLISK